MSHAADEFQLPDEGLNEDARVAFAALRGQPAASGQVLEGEIQAFGEAVRVATGHHELLDINLAGALASGCDALLAIAEEVPLARRALIQAAIRYVVLAEDGEHDLESLVGLDDDVLIFNAVAAYVGREELMIERPQRPPFTPVEGAFGG